MSWGWLKHLDIAESVRDRLYGRYAFPFLLKVLVSVATQDPIQGQQGSYKS